MALSIDDNDDLKENQQLQLQSRSHLRAEAPPLCQWDSKVK